MSIGNLKDYGNKGNNFPWQLKMLQGLQGIIDAVIAGPMSYGRSPDILSSTGVGSTPSPVYSFSIANVGAAAGTVNGVSLPAGVTINYDAGLNNLLNGVNYDATGTTFLITFIS
jgi:hypothetical protein